MATLSLHITSSGQLTVDSQVLDEYSFKSEVAQSCPTLSDPTDCGLPGSLDFPGKSTGVLKVYLYCMIPSI